MASNESEDAVSSMLASNCDDANGSNDSAPMNKSKRTKSGIMFRAWSFQVIVKADLSQGASTQDKARLLTEHLSNRTAHSIKTSFTSVSTFCYESQLSWQPDRLAIATVLFQFWFAATSKQSRRHRFPRCRNFSLMPPGNRSQEAWQATQSSVPTVRRSPSCMCSGGGCTVRDGRTRGAGGGPGRGERTLAPK